MSLSLNNSRFSDLVDRMYPIELAANKEATEPSFLLVKLKSSHRKFYGRHHDLVDRYGIPVSQLTTDMFDLS